MDRPYDDNPGRDDSVDGICELLDRLAGMAGRAPRVSVAQMVAAAGRRSFGPLLLLPGLIVFSPLSGVPGLPSAVAVIVLLTALQLLIGRRHIWLPGWVLRRTVSADPLQRALHLLRPVARVLDRVTRPRLRMLASSHGPAVYLIALVCVVIALTMPPLEFMPFANSIAGAALTAFGLALISEDGLLALLATLFCVAGFWLAVSRVLALV